MLANLNGTLHTIKLNLKDQGLPEELVDRFHSLKNLFYIEEKDKWCPRIRADQSRFQGLDPHSTDVFAELCEHAVFPETMPKRMAEIDRQISKSGLLYLTEPRPRAANNFLEDILRAAHIDASVALNTFSKVKVQKVFTLAKAWATQELVGDHAICGTQLRASALEFKLGTEKAYDFFEYIKGRYHLDGLGIWRDPPSNHFKTRDQLLGVYVKLQFDPQGAAEHFNALKHTHFYDKAKNQWRDEATLDAVTSDARDFDTQFLSLLIEIELSKKLNLSAALENAGLPSVKSFQARGLPYA